MKRCATSRVIDDHTKMRNYFILTGVTTVPQTVTSAGEDAEKLDPASTGLWLIIMGGAFWKIVWQLLRK